MRSLPGKAMKRVLPIVQHDCYPREAVQKAYDNGFKDGQLQLEKEKASKKKCDIWITKPL